MFNFYYFNPLKSTQIGSNADRTDDFPTKTLVSYKTYTTKGVSHLLGEGQQHHNSITITKKLPRM